MSDLLERLAAANPVPGAEPPAIADVWRKVAELDAQPRSQRPRRRRPSATGRAILTLAAVVAPIMVVLALAVSLHGAHRLPGVAPSGAAHRTSALDPSAQRVAVEALGGRAGSVVVLDPRTGAIKVMVAKITRAGGPLAGAAGARVQYPPEAAFDIVTAAAALDSGRLTTTSRVGGSSAPAVSGGRSRNGVSQSVGALTLSRALQLSANPVFAQVGQTLGRERMTTYMRRFGFYSSPRLTPSSDPLPASGVRVGGMLLVPTDRRVDIGRLAAGQGNLVATPLQMAMVAAAIADGGRLMEPHLETLAPKLSARVMNPSTARALAQMMRAVVTQGTGTPADLPGLQIAGKTGTAHLGAPHSTITDPWFIGFAPADHPTIAVAVALSDTRGGYGGTEAAPIAAEVIQTLLGRR